MYFLSSRNILSLFCSRTLEYTCLVLVQVFTLLHIYIFYKSINCSFLDIWCSCICIPIYHRLSTMLIEWWRLLSMRRMNIHKTVLFLLYLWKHRSSLGSTEEVLKFKKKITYGSWSGFYVMLFKMIDFHGISLSYFEYLIYSFLIIISNTLDMLGNLYFSRLILSPYFLSFNCVYLLLQLFHLL